MAESKRRFTENQEKAITARTGNLMVSASAGSGKTTVMVERILSLLQTEADISEILAITFTRMAAAEMREKLRSKICERLQEDEAHAERYSEQLRLMPLASVETIHSFCRSLLKSYFFAADLDPAFELLSQSEAQELKEQAIEEVFAAAYEEGSPEFLQCVRHFSKKRKDGALKKRILEISDFADSEEDPEKWLEKSLCESYTELGAREVETALLSTLKGRLRSLSGRFLELAKEAEALSLPPKTVANLFAWKEDFLAMANSEETDLYRLITVVCNYKYAGKALLNKDPSEGEKAWQARLKKAKDRVDAVKERYGELGSREIERVRAEKAKNSLTYLVKLMKAFRATYARLKKENSRVDFADLEHFTLALLQKEEVRRSVAARYKYVFVDEYQDVNAVQERIVSLLTDGNLFIVGDVKQSIYGFRGCNPDLFLDKMRAAKEGEHIELNDNFRSAERIIDAANGIFCRIMTEESCDINYEKTEKLIYGKTIPDEKDGTPLSSAEIVYYPTAPQKKVAPATLYSVKRAAEDPTPVEERAEAACIADLVSAIVDKEMIPDPEKRGEMRPVRYSDIAILSRGKKDARVLSTVEALKRRAIPAVCEVDEEICDTPEVSLLISLLSLTQNREEDVPLTTVLLSPIGKLTESDLLTVRRGADAVISKEDRKKYTFSQAAALYAKAEGALDTLYEREIKQKLSAVFSLIDELQVKAAFLSAEEVLLEVIDRYALMPACLGKRLGKRRSARVSRLLCECTGGDGRPLSVRELLHRVSTAKKEITLLENGVGDAVRIMTMHASKGLEFPVVILAGIGKQFNVTDASESVISGRERGLAPLSFFEENMTKKDGAFRVLQKEEFARKTVKEEMRLFYVAVTRAKNRLYVVAPDTTPETFSIERVKEARSLADFLTRDMLPEKRLQAPASAENAAAEVRNVILSGNKNAAQAIRAAIDFTYPYQKATQTPQKRTVTQMVEAANAAQENSAPVVNGTTISPANVAQEEFFPITNAAQVSAPSFREEEQALLLEELDIEQALFSGESYSNQQARGIRMHAFLETCDFSAKTEGEIAAAIRARIDEGFMKEEDLSSVPVLCKILCSPLFKRLSSMRVLREKEFTMRLYEEGVAQTEGSVLQGVIDLLAIGEGEGYVIDYKYSARKAEAIWKTYKPQLDLYARAAEAFYGIKITKKVIINLTNGETIEGRGEDLC